MFLAPQFQEEQGSEVSHGLGPARSYGGEGARAARGVSGQALVGDAPPSWKLSCHPEKSAPAVGGERGAQA